MALGFFKRIATVANFCEPAKNIIVDITGLDRKIADSYIVDHMDLFNAVIERGDSPGDGLKLVANFLCTQLLEGKPHISPLTEKYNRGVARKYDPIIISYFILKQDSDYSETTEQLERIMNA